MLLALLATASKSQCGLPGVGFFESARQYFADLFTWAHWWATFLAFGERMKSLSAVLRSIALHMHLLD